MSMGLFCNVAECENGVSFSENIRIKTIQTSCAGFFKLGFMAQGFVVSQDQSSAFVGRGCL